MRYNLLKSHTEIIDELAKLHKITNAFNLADVVDDHLNEWNKHYHYSALEENFLVTYCLVKDIL